jgi:uncharacterized protein YdhG (YjbR/CyaY superfamily)
MTDKKTVRQEQEEELVVAAIDKMTGTDKTIGERLHQIIKDSAPSLHPKTWYGMPAYADDDGKVICFFRNAERFKEHYLTLGFNDKANLDDGNMWPTNYALIKLTPVEEKKVAELVKKAIS